MQLCQRKRLRWQQHGIQRLRGSEPWHIKIIRFFSSGSRFRSLSSVRAGALLFASIYMLLIVFPGNIWPGFLRLLCKFLDLTSSVCNILIRSPLLAYFYHFLPTFAHWGTALKTARCLTGRPGPHVSLSAVGSRRGAAKSWKQPGSGT